MFALRSLPQNQPRAQSWLRWLICAFLATCVTSANTFAADSVDFESQVAPILIKRCVECHQAKDPAGGLSLISADGLRAGGDSGEVIDSAEPIESHFLARVQSGEMPPEQQGKSQQLPPDEIKVLERWIAAGADWPKNRKLDLFEKTNDVRGGRDWWSLQPIVRPKVPDFKIKVHPVDAFVYKKLKAKSMRPAPRADKVTLLRRLHHDLIGLPPSQQQIDEFVADDSADAWGKKIDELLQSPHYGERWARHWLDVVRYADTCGYERDQDKPNAWRYRDWVVQAFNQDMPYNEFITAQIAGDEMNPRSDQTLVATGFLRLGTWNDEPNEPKDYVYDRLEDLVHTTASTFIGLTVKCARCHTHKFDPILQDDYYRFASAFWPGPVQPRDVALLGGPDLLELGTSSVMGWTDVSSEPDPLHVLKNGEREQPLHEIVPATMSTIPTLHREFEPPSEGDRTTKRRLQLAEWITDPKNPLTPRVIVNRIWQHHFGQAIVRTPNNFGFLADPPTHPQLLDWLAAEFVANGGSMKEMHRLILTSRTWQQSSLNPKQAEFNRLDSGNRLWWRAERQRMDAEALRDAMLASSGELELHVGGESFKPTVGPEALEGLSRKSTDWQASPDFQQKRRSLYIYMKRGLLPPMMTAFDLCDATQSCGKRDVTIVPTQALVLLNNQFTHDRADHLARETATTIVDLDDQIKNIWSKVLRRDPTDQELEIARQHIDTQKSLFENPHDEDSQEPEDSQTDDENKLVDGEDKVAAFTDPSLCMHLRADNASVNEAGNVIAVKDLSSRHHDASQNKLGAQPTVSRDQFNGQPSLLFDGEKQFLNIDGELLVDQPCTIIAVVQDKVMDRENPKVGDREILSNWLRDKNTSSSLFLGLTGTNVVRFSDAYPFAGEIQQSSEPLILVATNSPGQVAVYQNGNLISSIGSELIERKLEGPWVVGTQGDHGKEYWDGHIAEIRVYERALMTDDRRRVEEELAARYGIKLGPAQVVDSFASDMTIGDPQQRHLAAQRALASLALVLMNSNEFIYID